MGLTTIDVVPLNEGLVTVDLMFNKIDNPGQVTKHLMPLPNLKALWLNGNPVADSCANFNTIGEYFESLEILNSKFTSKAGEWAIKFYGKNEDLEEIEYLDLSGKGVLCLNDISIFSKLKKLRKVDISEHPEFLLTEEQMQLKEEALAAGSGQAGKVEFIPRKHTFDEFL